MNKQLLIAVVAASPLISLPAVAFEKGDIIVRGGAANVSPNDSSSNINVGGDLGFGIEVNDDTQLKLTAAYFISDRWNVEVLAATPFNHDIDFGTSDPLGTGDVLGELKHLPPTITLNYYLPVGNEAFKPYVGAGLNYTIFFEEEFTGANRNIGLNDLELDNSFGIAIQVGFDYMVNDQWFVNSSIRWIDIDTKASFNLNGTPGSVGDIEVDPLVYSLSLGYRF